MQRFRLIVEYDGRPYIGWQKQPGSRSVQGELEAAVEKFCGVACDVVGAGRTDAGVHAIAQSAHVDLPKDADPFNVMQGINFHLFDENPSNRVAVIASERASDEFHARFSATRRHYLYRIINRRARLGLEAGRAWNIVDELDAKAMHDAAQILLGNHDFSSFRDSKCQAKSPIKTLDMLNVIRHGSEIHVTANARSFLHHQVRIMVGSLSLVGKGKWTTRDLKTAFNAKDRTKGGPTAPAEGLYLVAVDY